jgi:hypothetical protein
MAIGHHLVARIVGACRLVRRAPGFRSMRARRSWVGMLLVVSLIAAACGAVGPTDFGDIRVAVDNASPNVVTVGVTSSGLGQTGGGDAPVTTGSGAEIITPLAQTWEVKLNGKRILGSGDRADLALPPAGQRRDLLVQIRVAPDGTVTLMGAHYVAPARLIPNG